MPSNFRDQPLRDEQNPSLCDHRIQRESLGQDKSLQWADDTNDSSAGAEHRITAKDSMRRLLEAAAAGAAARVCLWGIASITGCCMVCNIAPPRLSRQFAPIWHGACVQTVQTCARHVVCTIACQALVETVSNGSGLVPCGHESVWNVSAMVDTGCDIVLQQARRPIFLVASSTRQHRRTQSCVSTPNKPSQTLPKKTPTVHDESCCPPSPRRTMVSLHYHRPTLSHCQRSAQVGRSRHADNRGMAYLTVMFHSAFE